MRWRCNTYFGQDHPLALKALVGRGYSYSTEDLSLIKFILEHIFLIHTNPVFKNPTLNTGLQDFKEIDITSFLPEALGVIHLLKKENVNLITDKVFKWHQTRVNYPELKEVDGKESNVLTSVDDVLQWCNEIQNQLRNSPEGNFILTKYITFNLKKNDAVITEFGFKHGIMEFDQKLFHEADAVDVEGDGLKAILNKGLYPFSWRRQINIKEVKL